jgi:hypothetical protein
MILLTTRVPDENPNAQDTNPKAMPAIVSIKAGGLDEGAASLGGRLGMELYTRSRVSYLEPCEGVQQEPEFGNLAE